MEDDEEAVVEEAEAEAEAEVEVEVEAGRAMDKRANSRSRSRSSNSSTLPTTLAAGEDYEEEEDDDDDEYIQSPEVVWRCVPPRVALSETWTTNHRWWWWGGTNLGLHGGGRLRRHLARMKRRRPLCTKKALYQAGLAVERQGKKEAMRPSLTAHEVLPSSASAAAIKVFSHLGLRAARHRVEDIDWAALDGTCVAAQRRLSYR
jgi:hypothetical protein